MTLRLLDAVVIAAIGLLSLKAIDVFHSPDGTPAAQTGSEETKGAFAGVLSAPHEGFSYQEPLTTGSVGKSEKKKPESGKVDPKPTGSTEPPPPAAAMPEPDKVMSLDGRPAGPTRAERELYKSLGERREQLDERARQLDLREKLLQTAEQKLNQRLEHLKELEKKLNQTGGGKGATAEQSLKNLVTMYQAMKPKDAARVFDQLPEDVLVAVVQQMDPRKMADILGAMQSSSAEKLTVALALQAQAGKASDQGQPAASLPANELPAIAPPPAAGAPPR